ncbi:putative chromatin remodeling & transcriptional activation CHROMO-DOMAIN family [Helianthus annuus]|nr:putative chromatin remodeling & transcriptional activation CHROMO-DOMAIN family [Helianthus annuus]
MKGGARRKTLTSDLHPPLNPLHSEIVDHQVNDNNNGGENGANDHEKEENEDAADEQERPKLAEGFYEIEVIRKKRIRKGVKQYLIKWRGWPESANTWEPAESFTSCPDVLEAFESMSSGKRKRKRKQSVGPTSHSKKKQQQDSTDNGTDNQPSGLDNKLSEVNTTSPVNQENTTEFAIHIQEHPAEPAKGASKVDETEVLHTSPRIGARRRKSCAVKRFKKELNAIPKQDFTKKTTAASDGNAEDGNTNADDVVDGLDSGKVLDVPKSASVITKIIKPVNYSISVVSDMEEVFVSFLVLRSDGEEIVVDNKYLKENNPVLLINFYEQHLRYNSPSE